MTVPTAEQYVATADVVGDQSLAVSDVTVRFGGLTALNSVNLMVRPGALTGLIGPNGAGKTTLFNVCSGLIRSDSGSVRIAGRDVTRLGPSARAQLGLGRTFQKMELYDRLSVAENVLVGIEARVAGGHPLALLWQSRSVRTRLRSSAEEALELCGISRLRDRPAGVLSTGQRRLVELARALAGGFSFLLLDEPSSGLDRPETESFGEILRLVVSEHGTGMLLVEHDMSLVRAVCDFTYVLEFGTMIVAGVTPEVLDSPEVRAAYLGDDPT
jgi:ABC-type branched-subunit amino acid transport system ATPase component